MDNSLLKRKMFKGVTWSAIETLSVQGIQFILGLFIARLVAPTEYGLIAMVAIFMNIAQVFTDGGFATALIQKQDRTDKDLSTVFYLNVAIAIIAYLSIFFSAFYIALFYREPQLEFVVKCIGVNILISSFSIIQRCRLTIELNFKLLTKISLISSLLSGSIGILLAYWGLGIIALIVQSITSNLLNCILLWIVTKWKPLYLFSWSSFKAIGGFSFKVLLSNLILVIHTNLYSLVIGHRYLASDVGFYNRAYQLAYFPSVNIVNIISRAIFPVLCQLQCDKEVLSSFFVANIRHLSLLVFPLMAGLAILAKPIIILLLTEKWLFTADLLSILCVAYMWYPIATLNSQILKVMGRPDYYLKSEIIKKVLAIIILVTSLPFGVKVICYGLILYNIFDFLIAIYFAKKVLNIGYLKQIKNIFPFFFLSFIMAGGMLWCRIIILDNYFCQLISLSIVGFSIYILLGVLFKIKEFRLMVSFVSHLFN